MSLSDGNWATPFQESKRTIWHEVLSLCESPNYVPLLDTQVKMQHSCLFPSSPSFLMHLKDLLHQEGSKRVHL